MAGLSGIVKKISDLVTGTPADDDCFVFGKSDLKKITLAKLKDVLGITSINSALTVRISDSEYSTNESMYDAPIYARAYNIGLPNVPNGNTETIEIELPDVHSAWIDTTNSYIYSSYSAYPLTYIDHTMTSLISAYLDFRAKKIIIQIKGNWEGFMAWIIVKYYSYS